MADKPKKEVKKDYTYALGRRKTAVARVRVMQNMGDYLVNGVAAGVYFPGKLSKVKYLKPIKLVGLDGKVRFSAKVEGSGKAAQLDALVHGLSRALCKIDENHRLILKPHGLLTRDPRMKEPRKAGRGGSARAKKQSPKR